MLVNGTALGETSPTVCGGQSLCLSRDVNSLALTLKGANNLEAPGVRLGRRATALWSVRRALFDSLVSEEGCGSSATGISAVVRDYEGKLFLQTHVIIFLRSEVEFAEWRPEGPAAENSRSGLSWWGIFWQLSAVDWGLRLTKMNSRLEPKGAFWGLIGADLGPIWARA